MPLPRTLPILALLAACGANSRTLAVRARGETAFAPGEPDDAAIWVHPTDGALSTIIATDKAYGLRVHDLAGRVIQELPDGAMNGVDLRDGFVLGGESITLVAASVRHGDTIALYRVDPATRRLDRLATLPAGLPGYGLCMYRSPRDRAVHVFVDAKDGQVVQWRLRGDTGAVTAEEVRRFDVGGQVEGCVADDALSRLYVGEEAVGIWRYGAEPAHTDSRALIARADGVHLAADVEGLALYAGPGDAGYLVASSQGDDTLALFGRGDNAFVASVRVVAGTVDGTTHSDGLAATSQHLGPGFPAGLLVVHDGEASGGPGTGNFKLVSWADLAGLLP